MALAVRASGSCISYLFWLSKRCWAGSAMADGAASPRLRFRRQNSQVPLDGALTEKPLLQAAKTRINMSRQQ